MSNNAIIDQIIANADIVKIIGKHVELKRSGAEFKGCCPFHGEKTPSFFVNPQKGLYNCFGCGAAGNALTFLKEYENLTAGEALKTLSHQTGIELPKEPLQKSHTYQKSPIPQPPTPPNKVTGELSADHSPVLSPVLFENDHAPTHPSSFDVLDNPPFFAEVPVFDDSAMALDSSYFEGYGHHAMGPTEGASSLYDLLTQISQYYQHQLAQNTFAQNYLTNRGLSHATIQEFALGYAPTGWQHLEQAFPRDIEGLKMLGLVRTSQNGRDFDLLRNRVIFPIKDHQGRVIGFAGRALSDEEQPKYINSSDSPVFHKQAVLYGLYEGRKAKAKEWLVVEGYMDVISLHQAGVFGAVASMGTALAQPQIERLLQLNPILTLSFDGDSAGQKAAWRAMEIGLPALSDGKELRFLTLPDNHDPDSYVSAHGAIAMQQQMQQAAPLSEYLYSSLARQYATDTPEGRSKILQRLFELTQKLPKGSYGWLLREDIKLKMGIGRKNHAHPAQDSLLNFDSELTPQLHLQLCFLFQPALLGERNGNQTNQTIIRDIYQQSEAALVLTKKKQPNNASVDTGINYDESLCLTWQAIADSDLFMLINWIQTVQPQLVNLADDTLSDNDIINAKAHFILAGLPTDYQARIAPHWAKFFKELTQRSIKDISPLITELVIQLMLETLQKQQKKLRQDLAALSLCIKHHHAIVTWQRKWLQRKED